MKKMGIMSMATSVMLLGAGAYMLMNSNKKKTKKFLNDIMDKANEMTNNMTN